MENKKLNGFNDGISPGNGVGGKSPLLFTSDKLNIPKKKTMPTYAEKHSRMTNFVYSVYQNTVVPNITTLKSIARKYGFSSTAIEILINLEAIKKHDVSHNDKTVSCYVWTNRYSYTQLAHLTDIVYRNYYEIMRGKWKASKKKSKKDIIEKDDIGQGLLRFLPKDKNEDDFIKKHIYIPEQTGRRSAILGGESINYPSSIIIKISKLTNNFEIKTEQAFEEFTISRKDIKESFAKLAESYFIISLNKENKYKIKENEFKVIDALWVEQKAKSDDGLYRPSLDKAKESKDYRATAKRNDANPINDPINDIPFSETAEYLNGRDKFDKVLESDDHDTLVDYIRENGEKISKEPVTLYQKMKNTINNIFSKVFAHYHE